MLALDRDRLRLVPWAVLAAMLALTVCVGVIRAAAVGDAQQAAVDAAEGHFRDVVADYEHRGLVVSEAYERVLVGSVLGSDSPISAAEVERRLDELDAGTLPGAATFLVIPAGAGPVWIGDEPPVSVRLTRDVIPGFWAVTPTGPAPVIAAVGYTTDQGDTVAALVSPADLLDLSAPGEAHGHGVSVRMTPNFVDHGAPFVLVDGVGADGHESDGRTGPADAHGAEVVGSGAHREVGVSEPAHPHTDVDHHHEGPTPFVAVREVTMFGEPWIVEITADHHFLEIPSSREVIVLGGLGLLLSLSMFGLVQLLVRRLVAESGRRTAEVRARAASERFAIGFHNSPIGCAMLTATGEIIEVNGALEQLLNRSARNLVGTPMADLVAEGLRVEWTARILGQSEATELRSRTEVRYEPDPQHTVWVDETASVVLDGNGDRHILVQASDVTEQRQAREELRRLALHDDLTGLANRTLLEDRLDQALRRIRRDGSLAAVMFMDVDQFKMINDTLGHGAGDQLIVDLAARLQETVREQDTIARFGGDEFVMLCENLSTATEVWQISDRIRSLVAPPFRVDDRAISVTLSIGIALCGPDDDAEALLRDADLAMYQAKELGRDRTVMFEREMRDDLIEQLRLEDELVRAIGEGQLELHYQPIVTTSDGAISGFEALTRWNHPERGLLAPDAFLPTAAQLGLMPTIDAWALETGARQLVAWSRTHPEAAGWTMAVNASAANFGDPGFATRVERAIAATDVDPRRLTIEITEDAILANTDTAVAIIRQLRRLGIRLAIDDFGTGYSSLSQLAALEIDMLKIDRSFVARLHESPSSDIVRAVIEMARALGIPTVAEGVETELDLAELRRLGATQAQGYLISKPLRSDQAEAAFTGAGVDATAMRTPGG